MKAVTKQKCKQCNETFEYEERIMTTIDYTVLNDSPIHFWHNKCFKEIKHTLPRNVQLSAGDSIIRK